MRDFRVTRRVMGLRGRVETPSEPRKMIEAQFLGSSGAPLKINEAPDHPHVLHVLHGILSGSLHNPGKMAQERMIDQGSKAVKPDVAFSDMPVSICSRSQRGLRIVEMQEMETVQAHMPIKRLERLL